jgi:septum formation protein
MEQFELVILASSSPRRAELLKRIFRDFTICIPDIDENVADATSPENLVMELAKRKARAVFVKHPECLVIGADTEVFLEGVRFGKPYDKEDAVRMLRALSGKTHQVYTGVVFCWRGGEDVFCEVSDVTFRELSDEEIEEYVCTGEPLDKAGAYGIQAGGGTFIEKIRGDKNTVVGLPLKRLKNRLNAHNLW